VDNPWEWMWQYANSWRSGPDHHDNWDSTESIIEHNVGLSKYAGKQNYESSLILFVYARSVKRLE